jgi:hypothetical protein
MHVPWESLDSITVKHAGVSIVVRGPVSPIDRTGERWDERRRMPDHATIRRPLTDPGVRRPDVPLIRLRP